MKTIRPIIMSTMVSVLITLSAIASDAPLPACSPLRNHRSSYNRQHEFVLLDGAIYVHDRETDREWMRVPNPKGIHGAITEISADGKFLVALDAEKRFFELLNANDPVETLSARPKWTSRWGAFFGTGPGMKMPGGTIAWDLSVQSAEEDGSYVDQFGRINGIGGGITTVYALREGGQRITYLDPWLPTDESYEVCGPDRGRFQAVNLSASGSTIFLINRYGDLFTRRYDFDMSGANWSYYHYHYDNVSGLGLRDKSLPVEPWSRQPKIRGIITDRISIFNYGKGGALRELRVEGVDASGTSGYFEKDINDTAWTFHQTGFPLVGNILDNRPEDSDELTLGLGEDADYSVTLEEEGHETWLVEILGLNPYCSPARLRVLPGVEGEPMEFILHTTETLRQFSRPRGASDKHPLDLNGTITLPHETWARRPIWSPSISALIEKLFGKNRSATVKVRLGSSFVKIGSSGRFSWTLNRR